MDKSLLEELDTTIRKTISGMKKVRVFDSHAIINHLYLNHRSLFDRIVASSSPSTEAQWVSLRRNIYARIEASSGDLIEMVPEDQSWSVLYDGSEGPCTYWKRLTKAERDAKKLKD